MWAFWNAPKSRELGKRMMAALYHANTTLITFPDWRTSWFFEDKIAQRYLMDAGKIPMLSRRFKE